MTESKPPQAGTPTHPWTYEISRPNSRIWIQSTSRFETASDASLALSSYLALTPEGQGSFLGRVVIAKEMPEHPRGYIVLNDHTFE